MSFETISIVRQFPVINGMVQLPNVLPKPNSALAPISGNTQPNYAGGIPLASFITQVNAGASLSQVNSEPVDSPVAAGKGVLTNPAPSSVVLASVVFLSGSGRCGRNGGSHGQQLFVEVVDPVVVNNFDAGTFDATIEAAKTAFGTNLPTDAVGLGGQPLNYDLDR